MTLKAALFGFLLMEVFIGILRLSIEKDVFSIPLTVWILVPRMSTCLNTPAQAGFFLSLRFYLEQARQYLERAPLLFENLMYDWCPVTHTIRDDSSQSKRKIRDE